MQSAGGLTDSLSSLKSSCASELARLLDLHEALMYEVGVAALGSVQRGDCGRATLKHAFSPC